MKRWIPHLAVLSLILFALSAKADVEAGLHEFPHFCRCRESKKISAGGGVLEMRSSEMQC
jgi:hypothetical protein